MELYNAFLKASDQFAESVAFEWEGGGWTFRELQQKANALGHRLIERLGDNRRNIGVLIPNTPNFPIALLGLLGAGHVAVPLNPLLKPGELGVLLTHGECPALLYDPVLEELAQQAARRVERDIELISVPDVMAEGVDNPAPHAPQVDPHEISMILYTSGTTGDPKGVMLSHHNIYSNVHSFAGLYEFSPKDTLPCVLPLFHTFAMTAVLFASLLYGSRIYLFPQFVPQKLVDIIFSHTNIILLAVPPMLAMTARFAPDDAPEKHNLRLVVSGGGPLPQEIANYFHQKYDHEVLEGYGLTETSPVVSANLPGANRLGTIGRPLPGVKTQVRDEEGAILPPNTVGELCVRGDLVMKGYYKNPERTAEVFYEDGWLRTGDLATIDEEGYMRIVGRAKDLIVCGGENIYPREIEEVLLRYPGVIEAAVVGKPHPLRDEVPYAFVVVDETVKDRITDSQLRKHCRVNLGDFKIPVGFQFLEELPKTATRKIQKEKLKRLLESENRD